MGPSTWAMFYVGTVKFLLKGQELLREGVQKVLIYRSSFLYVSLTCCDGTVQYKGDTFKVPDLGFWHVVTNKPELIEEIQMAPEDKLSFNGMLESVNIIFYATYLHVLPCWLTGVHILPYVGSFIPLDYRALDYNDSISRPCTSAPTNS